MADYQTWYLETLLPGWLLTPMGQGFALALAQIKDSAKETAKEAVKARLPLIAPLDALPSIAADRLLERGAQAESTFRLYLSQAFDVWSQGGTPTGILQAVTLLGFGTPTIFDALHFDLGPGPSTDSAWARFIILLEDHPWASDGIWDDPGTWDDGGTWDTDATIDEASSVVRQVKRWKGGHSQCLSVVLPFEDGELWDWPEGTWDDPGTWGDGTEVAFWPVVD
jgi:hypothetical protein